MKINVKAIDVVKGSIKFHFDGAETELSVEEVAMYFENMDKLESAFNNMIEKMLKTLEATKAAAAERHQQRMEELEKENQNDAAYQKRRAENDAAYHAHQLERENISHQHWIEKYGKEEEK